MENKEMLIAEKYLENIKRVDTVEEGLYYKEDVLLLPKNIKVSICADSNIKITGYSDGIDNKAKDMLRIIEIEDPLNVKYCETNIISPSIYVHAQQDKPWHITTQGFLITRLSPKIINWIHTESARLSGYYGKHPFDKLWLPCSKNLDQLSSIDLVCIFNRRISGWDGSIDRPVIELLGAGGHLQSVWSDESNSFVTRSLYDNLKKEFSEEIGIDLKKDDVNQVGGFTNSRTHELVIFSCIYIDDEKIPLIQKHALNNLDEDTDGIYLASFQETMDYYRENPDYFAGGEVAASTNFPTNKELMERMTRNYL